MSKAAVLSLAQKLANPATRSTLPMSKLPPAMQAMRRANQARARRAAAPAAQAATPLYNPAAILAGPDLQHAVKSMTDMQINPQLSALDTQSAQTQAQGNQTMARAAAYYKQMQDDATARAAAQQQASQQAVTAQQGIDANAQSALDGIKQGALGDVSADQRVRGGLANLGTDQLIARLAQNNADLSARGRADETALNQTGLADTTLANNRVTNLGLAGGETQRTIGANLTKALGDISSKRSAVAATRGGISSDLLQKLRQQGFDNIVTREGLGLKQDQMNADVQTALAKLNATSSHNKALEKIAGQRNSLTAKSLGEKARHDKTTESIAQQNADAKRAAAGKGGPKPSTLTRSQQNSVAARINQMAEWLQNPPAGKDAKQVAQSILNGGSPLGKKVDPIELHVAQSLASNAGKGIGPWGQGEAKKLGITAKTYWSLVQAQKPGNGISTIIKALTGK